MGNLRRFMNWESKRTSLLAGRNMQTAMSGLSICFKCRNEGVWGIVTSTGGRKMKTNSHWDFPPHFGEIVIKEEGNDESGNSGSGTTSLVAQVWKIMLCPNQREKLQKLPSRHASVWLMKLLQQNSKQQRSIVNVCLDLKYFVLFCLRRIFPLCSSSLPLITWRRPWSITLIYIYKAKSSSK